MTVHTEVNHSLLWLKSMFFTAYWFKHKTAFKTETETKKTLAFESHWPTKDYIRTTTMLFFNSFKYLSTRAFPAFKESLQYQHISPPLSCDGTGRLSSSLGSCSLQESFPIPVAGQKKEERRGADRHYGFLLREKRRVSLYKKTWDRLNNYYYALA